MDLETIQELDNNPSDSKNTRMLVVHLSKDEIVALDSAQGGESIDESTGYRTYEPLWELIQEVPSVKEIFEMTAADLKDNNKLDDPLLAEVYNLGKKRLPNYIKDPADFDPYIENEEHKGIEGDTELALFPEPLADFFDKLRATPDNPTGRIVNPKTNLRMYGWGVGNFVKSVVRVGSTIVGGATGGPFGAIIGNLVGRMATGQKNPVQAAMSALPNGLYAAGAQLGAQALGNFAPGLSSGITGLSNNYLGNSATSWLGNAVNNGNGLSFLGAAAPSAAGAAAPAAGAATAASSTAAQSANTGLMGKAGDFLTNPSTLLMGAAMAMKYKGNQDEKKEIEQERRRIEEANKQNSRTFSNMNLGDDYGMNEPLGPIRFAHRTTKQYDEEGLPHWGHERVRTDPWGRPADRAGVGMRVMEGNAPHYSHGGRVNHGYPSSEYGPPGYLSGPGKGQEDLIPKQVPEGSYILDSTTISSLGDGSSHAGKNEVDQTLEFLRRKTSPHARQRSAHGGNIGGRMIPTMLSDGEYEISPEDVALIGGGSNQKGAQALKSVVKTIRKHKNSNGDRLPPKSKNLLYYLKESAYA